MKTLLFIGAVAIHGHAFTLPQQPDSTGLAGDHFNLAGALELFKQSTDLSAFEQALNNSTNGVNNLDLDGNGEVDFIHVRTSADKEARVLVLQAAFGKDDQQDIASIQMERSAEGAVTIQILGDEVLYPENTIVEPTEDVKEQGVKRGGPLAPAAQITIWLNVWSWPSVQWCYGPSWWEWSSPWYWGYYPTWWNPWRPWGWNTWWGYPRPYWGWYHPAPYCRVNHANGVYMHRRSMSSSVRQRNDVRKPDRHTAPGAKPEGKPRVQPGLDRRGQPVRPSKEPVAKPDRKPSDRSAPNRTKPRTLPERPPQRPAPSRPSPQRSPGRR
jgi:hypothetical protein